VVQVCDGAIREGDRVIPYSAAHMPNAATSGAVDSSGYSVQEVGVLTPAALRSHILMAGQASGTTFARFRNRIPSVL
jgi:hypothetical protein